MADGDKYLVTLKGVTPILMHRDNFMIDDKEDSGARMRGRGKKADDRWPSNKWQQYLYIDDPDNGHVGVPAKNIRAALMESGKKLKIGRSSLKALSQTGISLDDWFFPLKTKGKKIKAADVAKISGEFKEQEAGAKKLGIILDVSRVKIQTSRHIRVRPMFCDWSLEIGTEIRSDELTFEQFKALWEVAGQKAGLCDWRPSSPKPGDYGMFSAKIVKRRK